jgi:hypothetical protein
MLLMTTNQACSDSATVLITATATTILNSASAYKIQRPSAQTWLALSWNSHSVMHASTQQGCAACLSWVYPNA